MNEPVYLARFERGETNLPLYTICASKAGAMIAIDSILKEDGFSQIERDYVWNNWREVGRDADTGHAWMNSNNVRHPNGMLYQRFNITTIPLGRHFIAF